MRSVVAVILAVSIVLEPAILGCWLLALWRRTRTPFLIGASLVAFPAWVVATNVYPTPRDLAWRGDAPEQVAQYRAVASQRRKEYIPEHRILAMWVMGAMLAGGGLYSFSRGTKR